MAIWAMILRQPGDLYTASFDKVPLAQVANSERTFPAAWITPDKTDVTDDSVRFARPLIGNDWVSLPLVDGIQRFVRLESIFATPTLPAYVPQTHR